MKTSQTLAAGISALLLSAAVASAEIKIVIGHNSNDNTTAQFKFSNVPPPAENDAATKAKFTIATGAADDNSGDISKLNDGELPTEEDQPDENFFFAAGSPGGRIQVDLGGVTAIQQVNTYSWHPNTRGPQLYNLYASDGTAAGFNAKPDSGVNPETAGWKLIAKVDARPKEGNAGGQYGVSISDSDGAIGKYRYLLFDCSQTESDDTFGNTFYSEMDVISADGHAEAVAVPVPLAPYFNLAGIYKDGAEFSDGLDGVGFACSANLLGQTQTWNGIKFNLGLADGSNVITAAGQTIPLPAGKFSSLRLLMLAVNGNQESQKFLVTYDDNTIQTNTQSVSDWFTPASYPREAQVLAMEYRNQSDGTKDEQTYNVYGYSFNLDKTKAVKSVTLPDNGNVKVFALTLVP